MKSSFKIKLFFTFVFYGLFIMLTTEVIVFQIDTINFKSATLRKASATFDEKNNQFDEHIQNAKLKILSIIDSDTFNKYLDSKDNVDALNLFFLDISNTSNNIMQLRFIDEEGMEQVRVNRDNYASKSYISMQDNLQNKSNRYYFKHIIKLSEDNFWYSHLDLNMEYNEIQKPIKPVLRIGTPVYYDGVRHGVLIINLFMEQFLKQVVKNPLYDIYIFDKDGDIIASNHHDGCWNKYIPANNTLSSNFGINMHKLTTYKEYRGKELYSHRLELENGEELQMLVKPKTNYMEDEIGKKLQQLLWIMLGVVLISFPFSYFFSKIPIRLKEEVDRQKKSQDTLLSLFDKSDSILVKWNYDNSIEFVSKSIEKMLGYSQEDFLSAKINLFETTHHDDKVNIQNELKLAIKNNFDFIKHKPYRIIAKDNSIKWILNSTIFVKDSNNHIVSFVTHLTGITALKDTEIKLKKLSTTDQLTQIYNRLHLDNILKNQYYRFIRAKEVSSIIILDIDFFKSVNDEHGHLVGDSVLIEFTSILQTSIRQSDILGRWGGEEFLIILPHTNLLSAMKLANKLRDVIFNHKFKVVEHKTASFGVAAFNQQISIQELLDDADKALYISKDNGRNCVNTIQSNFV